jgi:peptidoglycan/LPS O-acetylase OafA/YrhL
MGVWGRLGLDSDFALLFKLLPFFLGGVVAYAIFDRWGMRAPIGIASLLGALVPIFLVPGFGGQLAAPFLAYGLLWLSTVVPQPRLIARHDISYGFYIYAWPTAQLLVLAGVAEAGVWVFMAVNVLVTIVFAAASWLLIERPVMRATRRRPQPITGVTAAVTDRT